eukprot:9382374-Ditylum_brightwellii.AAC.1
MSGSKKPGLIDWKSCATREIILEDLELNGFLFGNDYVEALVVWEHCKNLDDFSGPPVVFDQFKADLKCHLKQTLNCIAESKKEEKMMKNDRQLYPEKMYNHK